MAADAPLNRLVLEAASVADDVGYVALGDLVSVVGNEQVNYRVIGGHTVTALVARWGLGADLYRETGDTDLGVPPFVIEDRDVVGRLHFAASGMNPSPGTGSHAGSTMCQSAPQLTTRSVPRPRSTSSLPPTRVERARTAVLETASSRPRSRASPLPSSVRPWTCTSRCIASRPIPTLRFLAELRTLAAWGNLREEFDPETPRPTLVDYYHGSYRYAITPEGKRVHETVEALEDVGMSTPRQLRSELLGPIEELLGNLLEIDDYTTDGELVGLLLYDPWRDELRPARSATGSGTRA